MNTNLVWFRNNLRTQDHEALTKALEKEQPVVGLYCLDPEFFKETKYGFKKTEKYRARFLLETLHELKNALSKRNIPLYIIHDTTIRGFEKVLSAHNIEHVFTQKEWTSEEESIQNEIKKTYPKITWHEYYDQFLFHPDDIPFEFHQIPKVFTDFRKKCEKEVKIRTLFHVKPQKREYFFEAESKIPSLEDLGFSTFETHPNTAFPFKGGENQAWKRIDQYFFESENLSVYKQTRNGLIGESYSSKLSAWLANGSISAKKIYWEVKEYEKQVGANEDTYWLIFELIWRDFFKYISLKHGNKIFQLHGILNQTYEWKFNSKAFRQWSEGNTREPFVNANMIELQKTGFMSNRGRQNVASFWAKEWEQDWRVAAAYFESMLIDYDVHSNYGNWIYNAGVGNDPRDRKFNIKRQSEMYDPDKKYQKLWLDE
jgi:deoxyribodipyrimidine photo-lyase